MESPTAFTELSPYLRDAFQFVATAAVGGVIGNRTDSWYKSLFYHQRKNLQDWLQNWQPNVEDVMALLEDENIKILFSKIIRDVSEELDAEKMSLWPRIADSIIRRKDFPFDKKQYFISLFNRLDGFALKYLATLSLRGHLLYDEVFDMAGRQIEMGTEKYTYYLGQLQCATTGLTWMYSDSIKSPKTKLQLSDFGREFVDFIGSASQEKRQ